jgi:hypothetical protein
MKITNYKSQITNKLQIPMTKITKMNKKQITTTIMGYDVEKRGTMTFLISKAFAGGPGDTCGAAIKISSEAT